MALSSALVKVEGFDVEFGGGWHNMDIPGWGAETFWQGEKAELHNEAGMLCMAQGGEVKGGMGVLGRDPRAKVIK